MSEEARNVELLRKAYAGWNETRDNSADHCAWRFRKTGKVVWTQKADSWRLNGGKAVEFYEFYDTAQVLAAVA